MKTEKIVYPELPPGYVYRKPGEPYVDKRGNEYATHDQDVDILAAGGEDYVTAIRGFVTRSEGNEWVTIGQRRTMYNDWDKPVKHNQELSFNDALSMLVARIWMGEWE